MYNFNPYEMLGAIAAKGLQNQVLNPGDYYNNDGLLVCGKCGQMRQSLLEVNDPTDDDQDRKSMLKVPIFCDCEKAQEQEREQKEARKDALQKIERLKQMSLMDAKFRNVTFDTFSVRKENELSLKKCRNYAASFEEWEKENTGLILWGNKGTGKSTAAACIANSLLNRGVSTIMTSFGSIIRTIESRDERESRLIGRLNSARLLIIDDLGTERASDYVIEKVYNVVDARYRRQKPLIITTNLSIRDMRDELDIRYARIYDRLFEICHPIQFTGDSWRISSARDQYKLIDKRLSK